jgi:hypothetical protein
MRTLLLILAFSLQPSAFSLVWAQPFTHGELAWPSSVTGSGIGSSNSIPIPDTNTFLISTGWVTKVISYDQAPCATNADFGMISTAFQIGASNIAITALARWRLPGNTFPHTVGIFANSGSAPDLFAMFSATVSITNGPANSFVFTNLSHPYTLTNGAIYWIGDTENPPAGDVFLAGTNANGIVVETTAAAAITRGVHNPISGGVGTYWNTTNLNIGPFSFIYSYTN